MAGWLTLACLAVALVVLASRNGAPGRGRRGAGPGGHPARRLPRAFVLAWRLLGVRGRRWAAWRWWPVMFIAVVILVAGSSAANGGGPGSRDPTRTRVPELSDPRPQDGYEGVVRRKRAPELVALQWDPPNQPSPGPSQSEAPPPVQPPTLPPPPTPPVLPLPTAPYGAVAGLATWYGGIDGFGPEDVMANGSQFNPTDPTTAAANGWPLGAWLRVCHTDRCIEVQVRDRGAFSHALDLSRAAFSQLAPLSTGVIAVTISRLR